MTEPTSSALTDGIRVRVQSLYLPEQSSPRDDRYVFAYTITISNESTFTAQLRTRHWIITDGRGSIEEVKGDDGSYFDAEIAPFSLASPVRKDELEAN